MSEFYSILTATGLAKIAALANGDTINLTHMAFGNGTAEPSEEQTELRNEKHRCALTKVQADSSNLNTIVAEAIIKGDVGGFWIREIGIYDSDEDLFAVGKYPATYKPLASEGSVKELGVRMVLAITNADNAILYYNLGIIDGAANTDLSNLTIAGQKKFNDKADLESPALTGTPTAPTAAAGTNTAQLATTAFVRTAITALVNSAPAALDTLNELAAALDNDPSFATTIATALGLKAPILSPDFTGIPRAPTALFGANTTQIANVHFVQLAIAALVNSSPAGLDTLQELAAAIGNDPNFATTITNALADKAAKSGDTIAVENSNPTAGFNVRNIKAQTEDPGVDSELATGDILLIYEN
jgi:phage-related tail fiber protein